MADCLPKHHLHMWICTHCECWLEHSRSSRLALSCHQVALLCFEGMEAVEDTIKCGPSDFEKVILLARM